MLALIGIFLLICMGTCVEENTSIVIGNNSTNLTPMNFKDTILDHPSQLIIIGSDHEYTRYNDLIEKGNEQFKDGNYRYALNCYENAAKLFPEEKVALYNQAVTLYIMKRYDEVDYAIAEFLKFDPDNEDAKNLRAAALQNRIAARKADD